MTVWSQRRRTVTLAVRVRGAVSAEASVTGSKLHFRYFYYNMASVKLDLSVFQSVNEINLYKETQSISAIFKYVLYY